MRAASATVRAIGPMRAKVAYGVGGHAGTLPPLGLWPNTPQKLDGMRMEPPASVPTASGPMPAATCAPAPPLLPPGVVSGFQGLRVTPVSGLRVIGPTANSGVVVLPNRTAPFSRRRATHGPSSSHGWSAGIVKDPRRVGQPLVRTMSLTDTGTPSSRPCGALRCQRASDAFAL